MKLTQLLLSAFTFLIILSSCKKDLTADSQAANYSKNRTNLSGRSDVKSRNKIEKLMAALPPDYQAKLKNGITAIAQGSAELADLAAQAKGLANSTCNTDNLFNHWITQQLADWNDDAWFNADYNRLVYLPGDYALVFENSSANQYFGPKGEYSHILTKTFKDLKRFWNIQTDGIVLVAMHGNMLRDRDKLLKIYGYYGVPPQYVGLVADLVLALLDAFPQYRNGEHPIFTLNSISTPPFEAPPYGTIPPKIIVGDGIMQAFTAIGYDDVAPQAILAHEYGHQIQFQLNVYTGETSPEETRRTELMADAYSAYYLSHARGAAMQWKRVRQFLQVFYNLGDCDFSFISHHGTPLQRMASAEWGYTVANDAQKQGHILTSREFTNLFEAALPSILAR